MTSDILQISTIWICPSHVCSASAISYFFFKDTATTKIYTLSLHDALPILPDELDARRAWRIRRGFVVRRIVDHHQDRKSTRLTSSHVRISYAVFCVKK